MKKLLSLIALVLTAAMLLSACGGTTTDTGSTGGSAGGSSEPSGSAEPSGDSKLAYFISIKSGGPAWSKTQRGFEQICAELGWEGHYVAPQVPMDAVEMAQLLDTAINEGADFIVGIFFSEEVFGDALLRAQEQGIVVCNINVSIGEPGQYTNFEMGTNQYNMGVRQAELLIDLAGEDEYSVLYLMGSMNETMAIRQQGFEDTLAGHDNIKLWGVDFENENAVTAADVINNTRRANPEINCIVCNDSTGATMGSIAYVEENGIKDDLLVIGMDDSADILNALKSGIIDCTIATGNFSMGYDSVRIARDIIENGVTPDYVNDTGTIPIYPAEVDSYAAENGIDLG